MAPSSSPAVVIVCIISAAAVLLSLGDMGAEPRRTNTGPGLDNNTSLLDIPAAPTSVPEAIGPFPMSGLLQGSLQLVGSWWLADASCETLPFSQFLATGELRTREWGLKARWEASGDELVVTTTHRNNRPLAVPVVERMTVRAGTDGAISVTRNDSMILNLKRC